MERSPRGGSSGRADGAVEADDRTRSRPPEIRTPDQRLRVFVSSTLEELAPERAAVREGVAHLRLSPVMFELGARPHPPRDLYRAYLAQSDVFVGIYWQRYGWVAPGESVSGLEDEYDLAGDLPKLIYVKAPAPEREPRLAALLDRVRDDDRSSYRRFGTPEELRELIENDLALLLSEGFLVRRDAAPAEPPVPGPEPLPAPATPIVGREAEIAAVEDLLARPHVRLVTLLGPGGIGKTRLAIEVARRRQAAFEDGVAFVSLAAVRDPEAVLPTIARALGARESTTGRLRSELEAMLARRRMLLLLDNFEQVVAAAGELGELLAAAPRLKVLVTSRAVLRLSGEHELQVPPLSLPADGAAAAVDPPRSEAVDLFLARARAVRPEFEVDADNAAAVAELCRRLDGLPLAIELAAARVRLLTPEVLARRLGRRLDLLTGGARDLPDRQRTLRDTIGWSHDLLGPAAREVFAVLSVFPGSFPLEAAEAVVDRDDLLDVLAELVDGSLCKAVYVGGESRFAMLETVRTYARERLEARGDAEIARRRHLAWVADLADRASPATRGHHQARWVRRLVLEHAHVHAAFEAALELGEHGAAARMGWSLWAFWWIAGYQNDARGWMEAVLRHEEALTPLEHARALYVAGVAAYIQGDYGRAESYAQRSLELALALGDGPTIAVARLGVGLLTLTLGRPDASARALEECLTTFERLDDRWGMAHALHFLWRLGVVQGRAADEAGHLAAAAELFREVGDASALALVLRDLALVTLLREDEPEGAVALLDEALGLARELGNVWYVAYCLEGFACCECRRGRPDRAALSFGAAEALRVSINAPQAPFDGLLYASFLTALREDADAEAVAASWRRGGSLRLPEVLAELRAA